MSKLFYDQIIILEEIENSLKSLETPHDEKLKLWQLVDSIIHTRVLHRILEILPQKHHHPFLTRFHQAPHDDELLEYIKENSQTDIEAELQQETDALSQELLEIISQLN